MRIEKEFPGYKRTEEKLFTYHLLGCHDHEVCFNGMGLKETMKPCLNLRQEGNRDFLFLFFYDDVRISVDSSAKELVRNKWIILTPGTPHSYGNADTAWCHSWVHFSGVFAETLLEESRIPLNVLHSVDVSGYLDSFLQNAHAEICFNNPPLFAILKNHLRILFLQISRAFAGKGSANTQPSIAGIRQILDFHYHERLPLSLLARISGYTVPYLCLKFKKAYNLSPTEYLLEKRIGIARQLLRTTDMAIGEISCRIGYEDIYYFSRIFKKRVGVSPSSFRKRATGGVEVN